MDRPELEARSQTFAVNVIALCRAVRVHPDGRQPADQLQDAATSAAANYRASGRARSRAEFVAKLGIVNEEMDEAVYWLEILKRSRMGDVATVDPLLEESKELRAIFASLYRTARRGRRGRITR
jgi:four helix bundle protein